MNEAEADVAKAAGAVLALSPGIDHAVLDQTAQIGLPFAPGIMNPSDPQIALRANCTLVKFVSAMAAGGRATVKKHRRTLLEHQNCGQSDRPRDTGQSCQLAWRRAGSRGRRHVDCDQRRYSAGNCQVIARNAAEAADSVREVRGS